MFQCKTDEVTIERFLLICLEDFECFYVTGKYNEFNNKKQLFTIKKKKNFYRTESVKN